MSAEHIIFEGSYEDFQRRQEEFVGKPVRIIVVPAVEATKGDVDLNLADIGHPDITARDAETAEWLRKMAKVRWVGDDLDECLRQAREARSLADFS